MRLADLQRAFQAHVLKGTAGIHQSIVGSPDFPVEFRLGVYADAYHLRLTEALAHTYPRLQQALGHDAFAQMTRNYLAVRPSTHVSVRWFGDQLSEYLEQDAQLRRKPWLAELAQWEWTVAAAFDAADAEPLTQEVLGQIQSDAWPNLRFQFHPSVQTLHLLTNAAVIYQALSEDRKPPSPISLRTAQIWLLWRQDVTTRYRLLEEDEAQALETVAGLEPDRVGMFQEMCEALCQFHAENDVPPIAAGMLKAWLAQGLIVAVASTEESPVE